MKNLKDKTEIELQKLFNDTKESHENIKSEIVNISYEIDELSAVLNGKITELTELEKNYVLLAEEIDKR